LDGNERIKTLIYCNYCNAIYEDHQQILLKTHLVNVHGWKQGLKCDCTPMNGIHNIHCIRFKLNFERNSMSVKYNPCVYCKTTRHAGTLNFCLHDHTNTCNYILLGNDCNCNGPISALLNKCPECNFESDDPYILVNHHQTHHPLKVYEVPNVMPEGQGKRDSQRPRYDLIPLEWKEMLADIFEEGLPKYGDSWMLGGEQFLLDCINHAEHHLGLFFDNDYSERQLEKVAWNCLAVAYHIKKNPELRAFFSTRKKK
jgi:hypothetical protein